MVDVHGTDDALWHQRGHREEEEEIEETKSIGL